MTGVFGDTLAMALVAIGAVLIALLIWLLMRKYNREYPREGDPWRIATPASVSPETTVTVFGPCKQPNEYPSVSGMEITKRASGERDPRPKETPAVSPGEKLASAEKPKDKPMGKTTDKKKDKAADKLADKQVADKEGVEAKAQALSGKKCEGSSAGVGSLEQNKEQQPKGEQRKKKPKKSDQRSPTIVDSGFSKRKSKQPKRSKPSGTQPDAANATTDAGVVSPTSPSEGVPQEPTSDTTSPALLQQPSQAVAQASRPGTKSPTVAIVDHGAASDTHDLDDSTLQKLRKEVMMRRASHVSTRSARSRTAAESPKVPTELDIFSEEHSTASIARAAAVREKQSHSGHKRKHKRKSSPSRQASNLVPADVAFSGSTSECTSPPPGPASPPGTSAGVAPASQARDLDESTLVQLRRDISMRRASHVSQHSLRPTPRVAKVPSDLDIFSDEHISASVLETTSPPEKSKTGGEHKHKHKHKHKPATSTSRPQETSGPRGAETGTTAAGAASPTGDLDESTVDQLRRDIFKRRASHVSVRSLRHVADAAKVPAKLDIFSEQRLSESNAAAGSPGNADANPKAGGIRVKLLPLCTIPDASGAGPASETGDLDEQTVQQLRQDLMKRRASHVSMHSVRSYRAPPKGPASPKVPTELDIFSEPRSSIGPSDDPKLKKKNEAIFSEQPSLE
ncbi:uncharacterized protein [Dermacentor andersoni]|uniref:uncharacterized protein n=1 Tax=Dermacentor andersoni TaxID=34620 RepID=UPI002155D7A0|nr:serine/arginine repetitive matrix protein 1-like [Dermacentor andersoni]